MEIGIKKIDGGVQCKDGYFLSKGKVTEGMCK